MFRFVFASRIRARYSFQRISTGSRLQGVVSSIARPKLTAIADSFGSAGGDSSRCFGAWAGAQAAEAWV